MTTPGNFPFECVSRAWQTHEKELRAFLMHRTGNRFEAEDLLQEVFLKSMRQGQGFCSLENPRAWLFQVARNALIDSTRLAKPLATLTEALSPTLSATLSAAPDTERAPVDELDRCVERNLTELDVEDRLIIRACDLQGQTVRSYADANHLSLAAAKSRLLRARKRLRDSLIRNCQVCFDEAGQVCCHVPREKI